MACPLAAVVSVDGDVHWLGPGWALLRAADEPTPEAITALVHPSDVDALRAVLVEAPTPSIVVRGPPWLPHLLRWQITRGEDGRHYAQISDVTALLDRAQQRSDALSVLLRSIVHDLRAPLRGVTGFASLLPRDLPADLPEAASTDLDQIRSGVDRMTSSLDALHQLATAIVTDEPAQIVSLDQVARQACAQLGEVELPHIELRPLPTVCGRPTLLTRAVQQLLRNAAQSGASRIELDADAPDPQGRVAVRVRDDGAGFDPDQLQRLVRPLRTLTGPPDPSVGMGIGLAIVHAVVLAHAGSLDATPSPSAGATLRMHLHAV